MSERNILASSIKDVEAYGKIESHVCQDDFTAQGQLVWECIVEYYATDPSAESVCTELLRGAVERKVANPKHKQAFDGLVSQLGELNVSPANVVRDFIAVKKEVVGNQLASALASGDQKQIDKLMEEYHEWQQSETLGGEESLVYMDYDLTHLISTNYAEGQLIRVYPKSLNDQLDGGCLRGHHIVVFARPEMGKTAFVVNSIYGFLQQGLRVLYVGNEDPIPDIVLRVVSRLTGLTKFDIIANPDEALRQARTNGYASLALVPISPGTPREIETLTQQLTPDVLIVDQLRNINVKNENFTQQLEAAAKAMRGIGQRNNALVISVTQAGDSASGKAVLQMNDVDSSNTGIPAQADVMIGIGATQEDEDSNRRVLSLCKNKRSGSHTFFPVQINPHLSKLSSMS